MKNQFSLGLLFILFFTLSGLSLKNEIIIIKAVGDVMLGSNTPTKILPPRGGLEFVESIGEYLKNADIGFCNFEGVFVNDSLAPVKCKNRINSKFAFDNIDTFKNEENSINCYEFGMPDSLALILKELNLNVVSLNNNHTLDYGIRGYEYTKDLLRSLHINYASREDYAIIEVKNKKIAIVAFGFGNSKFSILDINGAKKVIRELKEKYDLVIVSFHGGSEGNKASILKEQMEYFYGEKRGNVIQFARSAIDAGADLILGHGPHVLRAAEVYKGKLILYSLGNFLTYGNFNVNGLNGIGAIIEIHLNVNGDFIKASVISTKQIYPGIPVYDSTTTALKLFRELGKRDLPLSHYQFKN